MSVPFRQIRETRRARPEEAARLVELARLAAPCGDDPLPAPPGGAAPLFPDVAAVHRWLADTTAMIYVAAPLARPPIGLLAVRPARAEDTPRGHLAGAGADGAEIDATTHMIPLLVVAPEARGEGWGRRLVEAAMTFARRRGASRLLLAEGAADAATSDLDLASLPPRAALHPGFLEIDPHAFVDRLAR
jgi:GNAT superfamily N-acetyltransferase